MGCDFSWQVKQKFEERFADLLESEERIRKKNTSLSNHLLEYRENCHLTVSVKELADDLVKMLQGVEDLAEKITQQKKGPQRDDGSLCISSSSDEIVQPLEKFPKNGLESKKVSIKSPLKFDTTESILDDPEIVALISKNRNKFMRKVTGT